MKTLKRFLISLLVSVTVCAIFVVAWAFFLFPNFATNIVNAPELDPGFAELAEKSDKIDLNDETGIPYVNNEIVVFLDESATKKQITALFSDYDAEIDDSMSDIFVYRLVFSKAYSYEKLEDLIEDLEDNPLVANAYLNVVTVFESDAASDDDDFDYQDAVFPNDPWNKATWNTTAPSGTNWGVLAIDAPGAWAYLDQMSTVNVGLIDTMPNVSHPDLSFSNSSCLFLDERAGTVTKNTYTITPDDHGTHVAGTIGAAWDNSIGVSGVTGGKGNLYYSAVYHDYSGSPTMQYGTSYTYLLALKELIDQDVQAINISLNTNRLIGFAASRGNENALNYLSQQADLTEQALARIISARTAAGKPDFVLCIAAGNNNAITYYKDDTQLYGYRSEMTAEEQAKYALGWRGGEVGNALAEYNNFLNMMDLEQVRNRVIVVGAVGIDSCDGYSTKYSYAYFSNVGSRVDIVAPGVNVYSCLPNGYGSLSGTSMATPHVTGVAGLLFASNPNLSGPEVKELLVHSTTGRYYHGEYYSGLLNANLAVVNALKAKESSVGQVLKQETNDGLDLCFVVDTTGSMSDDIDNAKENMSEILDHLSQKTENYRVALVDYRDFPSRAADYDYPAMVQLPFSDSPEKIISAINALDLGNGGDAAETVYSALMAATDLDWRPNAKKAIILLGDAPPLDPEPFTDYTYDDVLLSLFYADISIDSEHSDDRVLDDALASEINVFTIGTGSNTSAADFFDSIATSTGGSYVGIGDASMVSDSIIDSIEQIELVETQTVLVHFGEDLANQPIQLFSEDGYLFTFETDESGDFQLEDMVAGEYRWTSNTLSFSGSLNIEEDTSAADAITEETYWFAPLLHFCDQHLWIILGAFAGYLFLCILIPVLIRKIRTCILKRKAMRSNQTAPVKQPVPVAAVPSAFIAEDDAPVPEIPAEAPPCEEEVPSAPSCDEEPPTSSEEPPVTEAIPETIPSEIVSPEPVQDPPATPLVCPNCGQPCTADSMFCGQCGNKL